MEGQIREKETRHICLVMSHLIHVPLHHLHMVIATLTPYHLIIQHIN